MSRFTIIKLCFLCLLVLLISACIEKAKSVMSINNFDDFVDNAVAECAETRRQCSCRGRSLGGRTKDRMTWTVKGEGALCSTSSPAWMCDDSPTEVVDNSKCAPPEGAFKPFINNNLSMQVVFVEASNDVPVETSEVDKDVTPLESRFNCPSACNQRDHLFCRELSNSTAFSKEFAEFETIVLSQPEVIEMETVLGIFNQESDPCLRGDINISEGFVVSGGKACVMQLDFNFGPFEVLSGSIDIPAFVRGEMIISEDGLTSVLFNNTSVAMKLNLEGEFANDFGGHIIQIQNDKNGTYVETENTCIKL